MLPASSSMHRALTQPGITAYTALSEATLCCCAHTAHRLLRAMDFQPRLGVVTRALQLAAPDLLNFFLVAGSVFLCYCVMGFLIFGNSLPWFATLGTSINTCFEMLLGEFADVNTDLRALGGLQVRTGGVAGGGRGVWEGGGPAGRG